MSIRTRLTDLRDGGLDRIVELAREHLGMDVSFVGEFTGDEQVLRAADGAMGPVAIGEGMRAPLPETYCRRMADGDIPSAVPDTAAVPELRELAATREVGIGAYLGVPLWLSDGTLYGSFCCISREPRSLDQRDVTFLALLADLVTEQVESGRAQEARRARIADILTNQRIAMALQPVVELASGRLAGVECLARFPGWGPPNLVFDEAHAVGFGEELELLAVRRSWEVLPLLPPNRYVAVNLAPGVATDLALKTAYAQLQVPEGDLRRFVLEITEHAAVPSYRRLRESLAPARSRGLRIAIDDAGSGYASLSHVVELQPDIIKIDRSLIRGMAGDHGRRCVIKALVSLAEDVGAETVAEGVENPEDLAAVRDLGLGAAQGYLFAKPTTDRSELTGWLSGEFAMQWGPVPRSRRS